MPLVNLAQALDDHLTNAQFRLRNRLWGRVALRRAPPLTEASSQLDAERRFYRILLDRAITLQCAQSVDVVWDVGCRNWSYVRAAAETFTNARLIGVELDGGRRYWNLHRRIDQARAHAIELLLEGRDVEVVFGDFKDAVRSARPEKTHAFCFFFPFVSARPSRRWGVPFQRTAFGSLLQAAHRSASGLVVSAHQGEWEAEIARELYAAERIAVREQVVSCEELCDYDVHVFSSEMLQGIPR